MRMTTLIKFVCLLMWLLLLAACNPDSAPPQEGLAEPATTTSAVQEDERLAAFFKEVFERDLAQNPEFQAYMGIKTEAYGRWSDYSDEFARLQNQQAAADLERLQTEFDYGALSDSSKVSYRIFEYNQQRDLRNFEWRFHNYAISQMDNVSSDLPTFLQNIHKIETAQDAEDYISRLQGVQTRDAAGRGTITPG